MPETCENAHANIWSQGELHQASHGWCSCILYFGLYLLDFLGMENFLIEITCLVFVCQESSGWCCCDSLYMSAHFEFCFSWKADAISGPSALTCREPILKGLSLIMATLCRRLTHSCLPGCQGNPSPLPVPFWVW